MPEARPYLQRLQRAWHEDISEAYRDGPPPWPREATNRVWHVVSAQDGRRHTLHSKDTATLWKSFLNLQAVRICYTATPNQEQGPWFDVPFFFQKPEQALQGIRLLHEDWNIPLHALQLLPAPKYSQLVVDHAPLRDAPRHVVQAALDYLHGTGFREPRWHVEPRPGLQERYTDLAQAQLAKWYRLGPVVLAEQLRGVHRFGPEADVLANWLTSELRSPADLRQRPAVESVVRQQVLQAVFPRPNPDKTLQAPRIHWAGSIDFDAGPLHVLPLSRKENRP